MEIIEFQLSEFSQVEANNGFIDNGRLSKLAGLFIMQITMLKAKLHRAKVTHSELDYEGSCAIDGKILDISGIREYEQIQIYNVNNGARFTTYAIRAEEGSGLFSVNGAAARLACPGDLIIVCAFALLDQSELENHRPTLVYFDEHNQIKKLADHIVTQPAS